jgi:hypothetical protein
MTSRKVVLADALEWCHENENAGPVVTSPPDAAEVGLSPMSWEVWFRQAVDGCMVMAGDHPCIFYVTDRRAGGRLWSKAGMVLQEAEKYRRAGQRVLWHKIALRRQPNAVDIHRPSYTHLICVGGPDNKPGTATPDVFERGEVLYPNGMGIRAAARAVAHIKLQGHTAVWNPFCGMGTVLGVASTMNLDGYGCDIDPAMVSASEELDLSVSRVLA